MKIFQKVFLSVIIFFVLSLSMLTAFVFSYKPYNQSVSPSQLVVILGAGYQSNGTPVPALEKRLQKGLEVWQSLQVADDNVYFLLSGRKREVHVMKEYLLQQGVVEKFIIEDIHGTNTKKTILNTYRIKKFTKSAPIFISQAYHLPRMKLYAWYYQLDAQFIATDRLPIKPHKLFWPALRESLAIIQFLLMIPFVLDN